jgi:hypothetical protein
MSPPEFFAMAPRTPQQFSARLFCAFRPVLEPQPAALFNIFGFRIPAPTCGGDRIGSKYAFGLTTGTLIPR